MLHRSIICFCLIIFSFVKPTFSQKGDSLKLGMKLSDIGLKYNETERMAMIISHGTMVNGYKYKYNKVDYTIGVDPQSSIVFISTEDSDFMIDSIKYLKIKFSKLKEKQKSSLIYEYPFAHYVPINNDWYLAFSTKDSIKKGRRVTIKDNAKPIFLFKRKDLNMSKLQVNKKPTRKGKMPGF